MDSVVPCGNPVSDSCQSHGWAPGGRTQCRPFPSPRAAWGAAGCSHVLRGTSCLHHPEDKHSAQTAYVRLHLRTGVIVSLTVFCVCMFLYLPFRIVMLLQRIGVCSWQDHQAAVLPVHFLHCRPSADDPIGGSEWEVMQILMHRVTRCLFTYNNRKQTPNST